MECCAYTLPKHIFIVQLAVPASMPGKAMRNRLRSNLLTALGLNPVKRALVIYPMGMCI